MIGRLPLPCICMLALLMLLARITPVGSTKDDTKITDVAAGNSELLAYARQRAALCSGPHCADAVVLGFANMGYSKFALNWVLSMRHVGMENYVLVALDQRAHAYFTRLGVPSFFSAALGQDAESSQHHKSPQFRDIMHIRLVCVLALLRGGLDVWLTDVDAVFNSDPFPFVIASTLGTHSSALAYDTPFLPKGKNSPLMVMAGFFFMRRCVAGDSARDANLAVLSPPPQPHAMNCEVLEDVLVYMQQHPDKHDQYAFNAVLAVREKAGYTYTLLDPLLFCNGALYFSERAPQMLGLKAVVVQNNHITGSNSKMHRFREHLLWYLDSPGYYANASASYLVYDNVQAAAMGVVDEHAALLSALALGEILQRTVILPLFCLYHAAPGLYAGSADWCTAEEYFELNPRLFDIREHSFLLNPQTPKSLIDAFESASPLSLHAAGGGGGGVREEEILKMFGPSSSWARHPVIKFKELQEVEVTRTRASAQDSLLSRLRQGVTEREETRRHINTTITDLGDKFACVLAWGKDSGAGTLSHHTLGVLLEALALQVNEDQGVYLAVDGLSAAHLDAFRMLFPHATAFELYPWLNQGLRRHQQSLLIHQGVCNEATVVLADLSMEVPRRLCSTWRDNAGPHCVVLPSNSHPPHAKMSGRHSDYHSGL